MRTTYLIMAVTCILLLSTTSEALKVKFEFDPQDLLDKYTSGPPADTTGSTPGEVLNGPDAVPGQPRAIRDFAAANPVYTAYPGVANWNAAGPGSLTDLAVQADYLTWRDNNDGELVQFNIWLDDNAATQNWDEWLLATGNSPSTGTASGSWSVQTTGFYDHQWATYAVQWTVDDTDSDGFIDKDDPGLVKGGTSPGNFTFIVDINHPDTSALNPDGTYTFWFGGFALDDTHTVWGPAGKVGTDDSFFPPDEGYTSLYFQGTMNLYPVPEPSTIMLIAGSGLFALMGVLRRKLRKR